MEHITALLSRSESGAITFAVTFWIVSDAIVKLAEIQPRKPKKKGKHKK